MRLDFVDTTAAHIYQIISDPSEVTAAEIRNAQTTPWKLIRDLRALLPKSRVVTLLADGEPVFIFGHTAGAAQGRRMTWFAATQKYFDLGARGVRVARKYLQLVKSTWPNTAFDSYSYSAHADCERWFRLLGFVRFWPHNIPPHCRVFTYRTSEIDDSRRVS
jgi:hypothetical protein